MSYELKNILFSPKNGPFPKKTFYIFFLEEVEYVYDYNLPLYLLVNVQSKSHKNRIFSINEN